MPDVLQVAAGKRTQVELEDTILQLLSTATGSLLDNVELINTLDQSKTTWEEVNESLRIAEETSKQIEAASEQYRPCSVRSAILYFVLNDLAAIDPMYQFSLDAYNELFLLSIKNSTRSSSLPERIKSLNDYHTYAVYKYAARGLFERHKLLLSLQVCVRILQAAGQINGDEWQYFLRGGQVSIRLTGARSFLDVTWMLPDATAWLGVTPYLWSRQLPGSCSCTFKVCASKCVLHSQRHAWQDNTLRKFTQASSLGIHII